MSVTSAMRHSRSKRRPADPYLLRNAVLCVAVCGLALAAHGCQEAAVPASASEKPQIQGARTNPPLPPEYAVLAAHLADEHAFDQHRPELRQDAPQALAEASAALLDLRAIESADADITSLTNDAQSALNNSITATGKILSLPEPPAGWEQFADGFVRGFVGDVSGLLRRVDELEGQSRDIRHQAMQLTAGIRQWQTARLLLPRIARKYAGPPVVQGSALLLDFDEAWGSQGPDDALTLVNNSGDLTNCTVLVELQGRTEVSRNVHFLPEWRSGQAIHARYSPGTDFAGEVILRQSVYDVQRLVVSAWADQLSQESIRYEYAGGEKDADIARYCEPIRLSLEYQPFAEGSIWNTDRAVLLRLDGIARLIHPRLTVTFSRGQQRKSWYRSFDGWEQGEVKTIDTGGELEWDPEQIEVTISFPTTGYRHTSIWQPAADRNRWTGSIPPSHQ